MRESGLDPLSNIVSSVDEQRQDARDGTYRICLGQEIHLEVTEWHQSLSMKEVKYPAR